MAKKKTENIKAAPVLRAQHEDPTPATITKSYAVRDKWLDKDKDNLVEFKSVDGEISDLMVNGVPAGGGGEFSTAEVTVIVKEDSDHISIIAPLINGNQATGYGEPEDDITVFTVILYKGTAIAEIDGGTPHIVSGNITVNNSTLTITGDGAVTVS